MKIVVFDLDETLGYFTQYGIFWDGIQHYLKIKNLSLDLICFNSVLDLYPEFLRPNIINILEYLKNKKKQNECNKIMIYTNNSGPKEWSKQIIDYFDKKINCKLFDQIIAAFKVNGKRIEICRTSQNKSHRDLIQCTKIPLDAQICFIDDIYHPEMVHDNVYYINIKPYVYQLPFEIMIERFINSNQCNQIIPNTNEFKKEFMLHINKYNYMVGNKIEDEYVIDAVLGKHIINHLHQFFLNSSSNLKSKTSKKCNKKRSKTHKHKCNI